MRKRNRKIYVGVKNCNVSRSQNISEANKLPKTMSCARSKTDCYTSNTLSHNLPKFNLQYLNDSKIFEIIFS